jgi:dCMP deaminase
MNTYTIPASHSYLIKQKACLYLDLAERVSEESYCERLQVGAVIVKDGNIISFGYNGQISGFPNVCEQNNVTLDTVLHAESNAITKACKSPISTQDSTLYCTHACCVHCAKLIIQSGITTFVYLQDYRDMSGIDLLRRAGLEVVKVETNKIK